MRKIGDITPTANDQDEFTDGDVAEYIQSTLLMAAWFNVVQRELCNVVEFDGTQPDKANDQQVLEAIEKLIDREIKKIKLGNSAPLDVGTTEGTVAAGDDTRITGALQAKKCLQELKDAGAASQQLSLQNIGGFPSSGGTISGNTSVTGRLSATGGIFSGDAQLSGNGDIYGGIWGGWLSSKLIQNIQRGAQGSVYPPQNQTTEVPAGCVMTGVGLSYDGSTGTHVINLLYHPLQMWIGGGWRIIGG
ncbi:hypothetical protein LEI94_06025 [Salmonella enterica]|nr:hypothetical protein [Salmonella enterica]